MTASASGYFDGLTRVISFQTPGASFNPGVRSDPFEGGLDLLKGSELSKLPPEPTASKRGAALPSHSVGSSVRARCRSLYHAEVARPRSSASLPKEVCGVAFSVFSRMDIPTGSLLNIVSDSDEITWRPGPANPRANPPLPRNSRIQLDSDV